VRSETITAVYVRFALIYGQWQLASDSKELLLLSSRGIGSGKWNSLSKTLVHIYQTVWCHTQETCSAEWRVFQRCCIQVKRWMSTYNMSWRHRGWWRYSFNHHHLRSRRRWVVNATLRPLYPPGRTPFAFYKRMGWGTGKENLANTCIRTPDRPALSGSLQRVR